MKYRPGDYELLALTIQSSRGIADLIPGFLGASIYESIFSPSILADITVVDLNDILGELQLLGDEQLQFVFRVPGAKTSNYRLVVHALDNYHGVGPFRGKAYTLKCVSPEVYRAKTHFVAKSYNARCSEIVQDILTAFLKTDKPSIIEETAPTQKIVIPRLQAFRAIDFIRRRSVSAESQSSLFVFYEHCNDNGEQEYVFRTLEKCFATTPKKRFQFSETENMTIYAKRDDVPLAFRIPRQFNALARLETTAVQEVQSFNFTTWDFTKERVQLDPAQFPLPGSISGITRDLRAYYTNVEVPRYRFLPTDVAGRPITLLPESTANTYAIVSASMENSLRMRVYGDPTLTVGETIWVEHPRRAAITTLGEPDPLMTSVFLITRLHHQIDKQLYTCSVECIKGLYGQ